MFGFGAAATTLTTDIAKYTIGRLRPHFFDVCKPSTNCSLPENQHRYIEEFWCTNLEASSRMLKEVRCVVIPIIHYLYTYIPPYKPYTDLHPKK